MRGIISLFAGICRGASGSIALRAVLIASMLALPILAARLNAVTQLDDLLIAKRFEWAPRAASGTIAFIAIDKRTLDEVGVWPWPRGIYATLLDRLTAANAADIFIDVDFSTPSNAAGDRDLASALERAGGGVLLPIFRQQVSATSRNTVVTRPISSLLSHAWPVFANVSADADGVVRRFDFGDDLDGSPSASAASALGGSTTTSGQRLIDFSIRLSSVPIYPLADVLSGKVSAGQLSGRSVVVGASATELKDIFPVPVNGALAGPLIHVLAAETLIQKRLLVEFDQLPLQLLFAGALIVAVLSSRSVSLGSLSLLAVTGAAVGEAAAFFLQRDLGIITGTVVPWLLLILASGLALNERIDLVQFIANVANVDARNTRRLVRQIIANSYDGIVAFGADMKIAEISETAKLVLGAREGTDLMSSSENSVTAAVRDLVAQRQTDPTRVYSTTTEFYRQHLDNRRGYEAIITLSPVEEQAGQTTQSYGGCIVIRDVTSRMAYEAELKRMAEEDGLTGLFNRREFLARLGTRAGMVAVIDIERFSDVCATLGRDVGDKLLKAVSTRLADSFPNDLLARVDGDLFAFFWDEYADLALRAERILALFESPIVFDGMSIVVAIRVGVVRSGLDSAEGSLRAAESALDAAKASFGQRWSVHDPAVALQQANSRRLEADMRTALSDGQFFLLYQPQIDLASGRFIGAEALLRWRHPVLGNISPTEFIPIAESSGMICAIGRWVLREACAEAMLWPHGSVSVNVSPIQFERSQIEEEIRNALSETGLPASRLCIELTESTFIKDGCQSVAKMASLRSAGVSLALDDFGTRYSSMSYLADLPLDKLKIDQSFVRRMTSDHGVLEIVKAIVSLARGLDLEIVAEGVEGLAEQALLHELQCETGQGYLFGRPQAAKEMIAHYVGSVDAAVA